MYLHRNSNHLPNTHKESIELAFTENLLGVKTELRSARIHLCIHSSHQVREIISEKMET